MLTSTMQDGLPHDEKCMGQAIVQIGQKICNLKSNEDLDFEQADQAVRKMLEVFKRASAEHRKWVRPEPLIPDEKKGLSQALIRVLADHYNEALRVSKDKHREKLASMFENEGVEYNLAMAIAGQVIDANSRD